MAVDIQGGAAQPVQSSNQAPSGGPAIPIAVLTDVQANARGVIAGPVQPVVEVTDGRMRLGGAAVPVVVGSGNGFTLAGPPIPVYVVSGSLNPSVPAPVNTVLPVISGTLNLGQLLTTTDGTWLNVPTSYTYQWKRGGVNIGGATNNTYTTVLADVGQTITVTVTASNAGGSTPATSAGVVIFTPATVSTVWLKADSLALNNGDPVTTWTDSSGNGNNAVQTSGSTKPTYKTNIINGLPVVRFDATNDAMATAAFGAALAQPNTIFAVISFSDVTGLWFGWDGIDGANRNAILILPANTYNMYAGNLTSAGVAAAGVFKYLTALYNGASSNLRINGVAGANVDTGAQSLAGLTLGNAFNGANAGGCDIAEIAACHAISNANRDSLELYLSKKYNF